MIKLRPHIAYAKVASESLRVDKVVQVPSFGAAYAVECQITPAAKGVTYTKYGLDLNNPHTLFCDVDDATYFPLQTRVLWDNRTFVVSAPPERMKVGLVADHARVTIEELTTA